MKKLFFIKLNAIIFIVTVAKGEIIISIQLIPFTDQNNIEWFVLLETLSFNTMDRMNQTEVLDFMNCKNNFILQIMSENRVVGAFALTEEGKGNVYLESFAIFPEYRNLGLGAKSLEVLENYLVNMKFRKVTLHVRESNPVKYLYQKTGFTLTHQEGKYDDGEVALFFEKTLLSY